MKSADDSTRQTWERQPNETSRHYRNFCFFRDLGRGRSQDKAYVLYCDQRGKKCAKAPGSWSKLSIENNWVERADDYDDWMDEVNRNERAAAREERHRVRSEFVTKNLYEMIELDKDLHLLIKKLLKIPLSRATQTKIDSVTKTKTVTQSGPLNSGHLAALVDAKVKLVMQITEGVDPKEPEEEERKIERVVWVRAPKDADRHKDPDPDKPDHPGPGKVQPISELANIDEDLDKPAITEDSERDKAV